MTLKMTEATAILLFSALLLAGCSGSDHRPPTSEPPAKVAFSAFVVEQYSAANTTETATPIEVESQEFSFADDDDDTTYDAVISSAQ